jgi:hypothetical protein
MFDLQIYQIMNKSFRPIMTSSVHRWSVFSGTKYLNCEEKISRCHSMNFEDYSADKEFLKRKPDNETEKSDSFDGEDPTIYMLTIG